MLGAVVAWLVNQWQQRSRDEYLRKEKLYRDLLDALQGFYESPPRSLAISSTAVPATDAQKTKETGIPQSAQAGMAVCARRGD
jgi:hypothetical protein